MGVLVNTIIAEKSAERSEWDTDEWIKRTPSSLFCTAFIQMRPSKSKFPSWAMPIEQTTTGMNMVSITGSMDRVVSGRAFLLFWDIWLFQFEKLLSSSDSKYILFYDYKSVFFRGEHFLISPTGGLAGFKKKFHELQFFPVSLPPPR